MNRFTLKKKKFDLFLLKLAILALLSMNFPYNIPKTYALCTNDPEIDMKPIIEQIYNTRSTAFVSGELSLLKPLFDISRKYGQWALEHEVRRVRYLREWSKKRNIKFTKVESFIRIKRTYKKGDPDHFAVVTGMDSHGYPLVNSHTTDRYHVPWDLG